MEKSAEEVRCGNKHALGVERGKRGEEMSTKEVEREECEGGKVMERCKWWGETRV